MKKTLIILSIIIAIIILAYKVGTVIIASLFAIMYTLVGIGILTLIVGGILIYSHFKKKK